MKKLSRTPKAIQNAQKHATRGERHVENTNLRALLKNASWEGTIYDEDVGMRHSRTKVRFDRSTRSVY